jgi:hypothetical protein
MAYHLSGTVCYDNYVSEVQVYYSLIIIHISVMIDSTHKISLELRIHICIALKYDTVPINDMYMFLRQEHATPVDSRQWVYMFPAFAMHTT